jgi:site-specific recombinase XerD
MVSSGWHVCQVRREHMNTTTLEGGARQSQFDDHVELFLQHLRDAGYAERTLRKKRWALRSLARWAERRCFAAADFDDRHAAAFLARSSGRAKDFIAVQRRAIRQFLRFLRLGTGDSYPPATRITSVRQGLLRDYGDYLRSNRGLAENSIHVYVPFIRSFLASQKGRPDRVSQRWFTTLAIRDFVLRHIQHRSAEYVRLLGTALRSFLRFLFLSGRIARDLSPAVPTVRKYRQAVPPAFLFSEEVERVLVKTDRSTSTGRRDYAILLLLARLGLRAGEIVALELDDLLWRTGEIVIHGKGNMVDRLPLLSEIGEALTIYLREDRGASASRRVFLRRLAPRVGLTGPAAIGHVVRLALARAGIHRSGRGAAHLFRHGLATKMIRHGASMAEIAELLRHRSQTTTAIYAQVSFEALRTVALPWPIAGGER